MPTPRPTSPATGIAEVETSMAPARTMMPPMPAPTAIREIADREDGRDEGPEDDEQDHQRDQQADADVAGAAAPGVEEDGVAAELDADAGRTHARDGVGQHGEGRLAHLPLGHVEGDLRIPDPPVGARRCPRRTGRRPSRRGRGSGRRRAPPRRRRAACSSDRARIGGEDHQGLALGCLGEVLGRAGCIARSLWLPLAEKSSAKVPPTVAARKSIAPSRTSIQLVTVRQGCLALAMATVRVNLFMVVCLSGLGPRDGSGAARS